ncbi:hypothetical protein SAMN05428950_102243 [Sphingomonas sp. OV641]|nr:hypothetical protein SAMN05428950_102243 [Sphingomonas sp. OV641]
MRAPPGGMCFDKLSTNGDGLALAPLRLLPESMQQRLGIA